MLMNKDGKEEEENAVYLSSTVLLLPLITILLQPTMIFSYQILEAEQLMNLSISPPPNINDIHCLLIQFQSEISANSNRKRFITRLTD